MEIFGRRLLQKADTSPEKVSEAEFGRDSDNWRQKMAAGGPDVNPLLTGRAKHAVYSEMRKTDASVKSLLWMERLPVRSASWDAAEPKTPAPIDRLIADAVRVAFGLADEPGMMAQSWGASIDQGLGFTLAHGSFFEEIIWDPVTTWHDADGDPHELRWIARLAPRFPATIEEAEFERGRVKQIKQMLPGTKAIPGDKLCYYVLEPEGSNWDGTSMLRAAWGPWMLKKELMIAAGIGWDRFSAGLPEVRYPKGGGDKAREEAEQIGRGVRLHEEGYVALEGPEPTAEAPDGWGFKVHSTAQTLADPVPLLRAYSGEIAASGLQQFSSLGTTERGSRAVGEVLAEPFYLAVQAIAKDFARDRTRQLVRRFVDVNFGPQYDVPRLTVSKIQARSLSLVAQVIGDLGAANLTFSDRASQNYMRTLMEWPLLEEDPEINRERLRSILKLAGLGDDRISEILAALPEDATVVPNLDERVPVEGGGL